MGNAGKVISEALIVALAGLVFAFAANALSPLGLRLTMNYFPGGGKPALPTPVKTTATTTGMSTNVGSNTPPAPVLSAVAQRLQARGLQLVNSNSVFELFQDPRYQQGLVAFIDARDEEHYSKGHIPGAWQFNHYRPDAALPTILPLCLIAQKVVVYCTGGDCEDSEFAAIMLRDAGVPKDNLFVYTGGISEWKALGRPVESGGRGSGQMVKP